MSEKWFPVPAQGRSSTVLGFSVKQWALLICTGFELKYNYNWKKHLNSWTVTQRDLEDTPESISFRILLRSLGWAGKRGSFFWIGKSTVPKCCFGNQVIITFVKDPLLQGTTPQWAANTSSHAKPLAKIHKTEKVNFAILSCTGSRSTSSAVGEPLNVPTSIFAKVFSWRDALKVFQSQPQNQNMMGTEPASRNTEGKCFHGRETPVCSPSSAPGECSLDWWQKS